jgi:hypothetical protein
VQALSVAAPEVALAALALESGRDVFRDARLVEHARAGLSRAEALRVLHDTEPSLQQLGHREAGELLASLMSEEHPLLGEH